MSFDLAEYTAEVDGVGTLRLLDAIRTCGLSNTIRLEYLLRLSKIWFISIEFSVSMGSFYQRSVLTANDPPLPNQVLISITFYPLGSIKHPLQSFMEKCKKFLKTRKLHSTPEVHMAWLSFLPTGKDLITHKNKCSVVRLLMKWLYSIYSASLL